MRKFNCNQCGACCKVVGDLVRNRLVSLPIAAFFKPDEKGWCQHLRKKEDGKYECSCYDTRPLMCRVEDVCKMKASRMNLTQDELMRISEDMCELLRSKYNDK